jgi:hypothetical protein
MNCDQERIIPMSIFAIVSFIAYILVFTGVALGLYFGLSAAKII